MIATITEIASALQKSRQAINARNKKFCWQAIPGKVQGGGKLYDIDQIPLAPSERKKVKGWLTKKSIDTAVKTVNQDEPTTEVLPAVVGTSELPELPAPASLKQWQRECMDARIYFMRLIERSQENGAGINRTCAALEEQARTNTLPAEAAPLVPIANKPSGKDIKKRALSASTLIKWWSTWLRNKKDPTSLAPKDTEKDGIPAWAPYFFEWYRRPQKPSVPQAMEDMKKHLPPGVNMPSDDQVYRFLKKCSRLDLMKGRMTGAELARVKTFTRRDTSDLYPLDVCLCDGHSFKAKVAHPRHGRPFKPEICGVIDAGTCAMVGWSTGISESNQTVADALRHAYTVTEEKPMGGMLAILYTDKGAGNEAEVNANPYFGRYARLGATFKTGRPGNPRARGKIERPNKSVWIPMAKTLATYTGKDMDKGVARKVHLHLEKEVRAAKKAGTKPESKYLMSWEGFIQLCQETVDAYNNRPHSSLPKIRDPQTGRMRRMTPAEAWQQAVTSGWRPEVLPAEQLDDLFRPWEEMTTRNGEVRLFNNTYFHKELEHYHGMKVIVEYEVQNGDFVWVRDIEHHRLICIAGFEANKRAFFPTSAIDDAREKRSSRRLKLKTEQIEEIFAERDGVLELKTVEQSSEAIELRRQLEQQMQNEAPIVSAPSPTSIAATVLPLNVVSLEQESVKQRYNRWKALKAKLVSGEIISEEDYRFVMGFEQSADCKAFQQMEKDLVVMNK